MRYTTIRKATFLARPNRFIAQVLLEGEKTTVHVKNTGRCRELLVPGASVYLAQAYNPARKTQYDLVAVEKGRRLINMDAQAPNQIFREWAESGKFRPGLTLLRPETTWGNSRFDFYWEEIGHQSGEAPAHGFVEVKGCTLEEENWTLFPDAPTQRGVKHMEELTRARAEGYEAAVCFVIQMEGVSGFSPNDRTHPAFGAVLRKAVQAGVKVLAYECAVSPGEIVMTKAVPVLL